MCLLSFFFFFFAEARVQGPPQMYTGDPRPRIPPRVMALSAMGFKLGIFAKRNAKLMHPRSSHTMRQFTHVYLHAQTAVDADDYTPDESQLF